MTIGKMRMLYYMPGLLVALIVAGLSLWEDPTLPAMVRTCSDKTLHALMYTGLALACMAGPYMNGHRRFWHYAAVWVATVAYGGLMEILQAYCTRSRSGDWWDLVADMAGATIGVAVFWLGSTGVSKTKHK